MHKILPDIAASTVIDEPGDVPLVERPAVARPAGRGRGLIGYGVVVAVGGAVLWGMTAQRHGDDGSLIPAASAAATRFTAPQPLPGDLPPGAVAAGGMSVYPTGEAVTAPQFAVDNVVSMPVQTAGPMPVTTMTPEQPIALTSGTALVTGANRLTSPAMIVDLSDAPAGKPDDAALASPALAGAMKSGARVAGATDEASFVQRVGTPSERVSASRIGDMTQVIAEGTVLTGTLETAINSDLPGFARAVIARNVLSFDGSRVLIPRGSRVVGQYKSGVAMGASRVFVIWTRLIRPDGVSVQLLSPGGDDLGRGGLAGRIDRHFLQRFGGSILTSVLSGAVQLGSAALGGRTPVYINTVADATAAAGSATRTADIPPTIRTPQGVAIKIFVARDLDFSTVEAAR